MPEDEFPPHVADPATYAGGPRYTSAERGRVIEVDGGAVSGVRKGSIQAWRGIPYAAPPVGPLRLRAPAPVVPWDGVRDASEFGSEAPQIPRVRIGRAASREPMSEDCLTVNVNAPSPAPGGGVRLPVVVFIHGGGYYEGTSSDDPGQGEAFVRTGRVVFVSFNYRLGPLGYLDFTRYSTPERPLEGNLGLRDQVAALRWVHGNISAFGGDPDNVTVFGESAGGNAVTTLLAVPSARGLFSRAIAQSAPANAVYPQALADRWSADYLRLLRVGGPHQRRNDPEPPALDAAETGSLVRERLLHGTVEDLLAAAQVMQSRTPDAYPGAFCFAPVVDGAFVPERPIEAIRAGRAAPVPLIIGTNEREGSIFRGRLNILPGSASRIEALFQRAPAETRRQMSDAYPGLPHWRPGADFGGDYGFWYPTTRVADFHSRFAPVHAYRFDVAPRLLRLVGLDATHGVEMFTLFDRTEEPLARTITSLGGRGEYARAGDRMRSRWIRFAESGTTTPSWPAYSEAGRATLIFDAHDRIQMDPNSVRRMAWNRFLPRLGDPGTAPAF